MVLSSTSRYSYTVTLASISVAFVAYRLAVYLRSSTFLPIQERDAIVVTGAHTGIGKHAALSLAKEGFTVFCGVRKLKEHGDELLDAAKTLDIDISKIKPILLDVTKPDQIDAAVQEVTAFVGEDHGLFGLFNNAGIISSARPGEGRSVEHVPMESLQQLFDVNYFGLVRVTQAFLPLIRRRKGRILSNTSVSGIFAGPFWGPYSSSKFAVEAMMDSLRREMLLTNTGVSVSILEPGFIKTSIFQKTLEHILQFQGVGIYAQQETAVTREFGKMALEFAASPKVTSAAVVHAMRSSKPKIRYLVGGMAGMVQLLGTVPSSWGDAALVATKKGKNDLSSDFLKSISNITDEKSIFSADSKD